MNSSELVSAPRGLLKIFIIDMASKYPISGKEISERVSSITNSVWTPSPGSIYYILKELVSSKKLSNIYTPDKGIKKYITTDKGLDDLSLFKQYKKEILIKQAAFIKLSSYLMKDNQSNDFSDKYISELEKYDNVF